MKTLLLVGAGSFIGGIARYLLSQFVQSNYQSAFPFATWVVNILGCFFIGIVFALANKTFISHDWQLFLATGMLGGFTTFSAFSNETFGLITSGQVLIATLNAASSVVLGLLATYCGYAVVKLSF